MDYTALLMLGVVGVLFCKFVLFMVLIAGFQFFRCEVQNTNTNTAIVKGGYLQLTCNKLDIETLKTLLMVTP